MPLQYSASLHDREKQKRETESAELGHECNALGQRPMLKMRSADRTPRLTREQQLRRCKQRGYFDVDNSAAFDWILVPRINLSDVAKW